MSVKRISQMVAGARSSGRSIGAKGSAAWRAAGRPLSTRNRMIVGGSALGVGGIAKMNSTGRGSTPGARSLYGLPTNRGQYY